MVGFKELLRRLQIQEQMTKQHQTRVDVSSNIATAAVSHCSKCGGEKKKKKKDGQDWAKSDGLIITKGI